MAKKASKKTVETLKHTEDRRTNIPTAEFQSVMRDDEQNPIQVAYERRNRDLDPQFIWRGKDAPDWSDLVVQAPPLFIQEKVYPKVLIDDLVRRTYCVRLPGLLRGKLHSAIVRAMKPLSGSASLAVTNCST